MTRSELKEFALVNIDAFDMFFEKNESKMICMFANYISEKQMYHICFMDFTSLLFFKILVEKEDLKKIKLEELYFDEIERYEA